MQPPEKKRTPRENLGEYAMRLLEDPNNSNDPAFAELRREMARKLLDAHIKGNVQVSPRTAMIVGTPSLLGMGGFAVYAALHFTRTIFYPVLGVCLLFAILLIVLLLALCGVMADTVVAKILTHTIDKAMAKLGWGHSGDEKHETAVSAKVKPE
jgi:hypothetical protein